MANPSDLISIVGEVSGIRGEISGLATKEDVAVIRTRIDALATKEEVAEIRTRQVSLASKDQLAELRGGYRTFLGVAAFVAILVGTAVNVVLYFLPH